MFLGAGDVLYLFRQEKEAIRKTMENEQEVTENEQDQRKGNRNESEKRIL